LPRESLGVHCRLTRGDLTADRVLQRRVRRLAGGRFGGQRRLQLRDERGLLIDLHLQHGNRLVPA